MYGWFLTARNSNDVLENRASTEPDDLDARRITLVNVVAPLALLGWEPRAVVEEMRPP